MANAIPICRYRRPPDPLRVRLATPAALDADDLRKVIDADDTKALYDYMKAHGSALCVRWDEVAETFVCTWQVGARQIVGTSWHPRVAIVAAATQALD